MKGMAMKAFIGALLCLGACASPPEEMPGCAADASAPVTTLRVRGEGACARQVLASPAREHLSCGGLPAQMRGSRVRLEGPIGVRWIVRIGRSDGSSASVCAATLDADCQCDVAGCTTSSAEETLTLDLGMVEQESVDLMVEAGTYVVEVCSG